MNKLKNYLKELQDEGVIHPDVKSQILHLANHALREEMLRAYMYGQTNAEMMEAGLERSENEEYVNWRMLALNKQI
jgi:hypothetical protein